MDIGRKRALMRKFTSARKQQSGASALTPKVGAKGAPKRKNDSKDDRPPKKGIGPFAGDK